MRQSHPSAPQARSQKQPSASRRQNRPMVSPADQKTTQPDTTITAAIDLYLQDQKGGNRSPKTLEWHTIALGLLRTYLEEQRTITVIEHIDAPVLSAWFAHLRTTPGTRGRMRSERTVQTYARSARAFFHWLIRRKMLTTNPFEQVVFPKVGKPRIQTIEPEEFERLLLACAMPREAGQFAERAVARNRAILWLLYDTGIRVSELVQLRLADLDRKHAIITVTGKGSKQRRIALGQNCQRHLLHYLDRHRPGTDELATWGNAEEDHLFLAEMRTPLTKNGMEMLFKRLRERAGLTGKRISPHILRHTFAINYLIKSNDPFSLQELLGHEDIETVKLYMHMNDTIIQEQKRKYSPGDHFATQVHLPEHTRRTGFHPKNAAQQKR